MATAKGSRRRPCSVTSRRPHLLGARTGRVPAQAGRPHWPASATNATTLRRPPHGQTRTSSANTRRNRSAQLQRKSVSSSGTWVSRRISSKRLRRSPASNCRTSKIVGSGRKRKVTPEKAAGLPTSCSGPCTREHRDRGGHDLRSWFITTCQEHGAHRDLLRVVTHTSKGDVVSGYTRAQWPALCAEVAKLRQAADVDPRGRGPAACYRRATTKNRWRKVVTPMGLEAAPGSASVRENPLVSDGDAGSGPDAGRPRGHCW
jgi:hypothetical protein